MEHVTYDVSQEYHIHIDRNGDFYPNVKISDTELKEEGKNQLSVWAERHPKRFEAIAKTYLLRQTAYSAESYRILQDSIIADISRSINRFSEGKFQTWLIHGFRKKMYEPVYDGDKTSVADNDQIKERLRAHINVNSRKENYFVEVFWDGRYLRNQGILSAIKLAEMFKRAIPNARNCGYALRSIFKNLESKKINVITHSTGTHVAAHLLFNVMSRFEYMQPTPDARINLVLVASASSGKKLFDNYYDRNTSFHFEAGDNYKVINVYNKRDGVLRKNMWYPSRASTKLGCNYRKESDKLYDHFSKVFPHSSYLECPNTFDIPRPPRTANHTFTNYVEHKSFDVVLNIIFAE